MGKIKISGKKRRIVKAESLNARPPKFPLFPSAEAKLADVDYFLNLLAQVSCALEALGYMAEGHSLTLAKKDLQKRIFGLSESRHDTLTTIQ